MTRHWVSMDERIREMRRDIQRKHNSVANDSLWAPMDAMAEMQRRAIVFALEELSQASIKTDAPLLLWEMVKEAQRLYREASSLPGHIPF